MNIFGLTRLYISVVRRFWNMIIWSTGFKALPIVVKRSVGYKEMPHFLFSATLGLSGFYEKRRFLEEDSPDTLTDAQTHAQNIQLSQPAS